MEQELEIAHLVAARRRWHETSMQKQGDSERGAQKRAQS